MVLLVKTFLARHTEQNCGRNGPEAWRGLYKRFDPLTGGRRRNLLRDHGEEVEFADDIMCSAVKSKRIDDYWNIDGS